MAEVIAPDAGLRLEVQLFGHRIVQIVFLAIDERRQPQSRLHVRAPAVEVEIPARMSGATVSAIESHNVEVLIFDPDPSEEAALAGLGQRRDVKHQATHFAQKFAFYVVELIMLPVESIGIDENHLQKT